MFKDDGVCIIGAGKGKTGRAALMDRFGTVIESVIGGGAFLSAARLFRPAKPSADEKTFGDKTNAGLNRMSPAKYTKRDPAEFIKRKPIAAECGVDTWKRSHHSHRGLI